jgi:hypothetical protein
MHLHSHPFYGVVRLPVLITTATLIKQIQVAINLIDIKEDKVMVTVKAPSFNTDEITYHIPKNSSRNLPEDNYGKFIDSLKAYDAKGNL